MITFSHVQILSLIATYSGLLSGYFLFFFPFHVYYSLFSFGKTLNIYILGYFLIVTCRLKSYSWFLLALHLSLFFLYVLFRSLVFPSLVKWELFCFLSFHFFFPGHCMQWLNVRSQFPEQGLNEPKHWILNFRPPGISHLFTLLIQCCFACLGPGMSSLKPSGLGLSLQETQTKRRSMLML